MALPVERLQETVVLLAYIGFLFSLFLIISHVVNRRLTINAYTTLQSLSIIIFCIPFSFLVIHAKKTVCFDPITHSTGKSNIYCHTQGILFVLGFHAVVLSLVVRVFSIYMIVVWSRNIPRVYPTILTLGIATTFASASGPFITYEGGAFCSPSPHTTKALLQVPLLIYSCVGILLQVGTTFSVTKTLWIVRTNITKSRYPDSANFQLKKRQKFNIGIVSYLKSIKLLWRTYILSMFLAAVMAFVTFQYMLLTRHGSYVNDRLATIDWVSCILVKGTEDKCRKYLQGEGMYVRTLVIVILLLLFTILFLTTEFRVFLFRAWFQFLKHPKAFFSRKRSDRILDSLDDALSNVWLPEKLQNKFLGSFRYNRNEAATQRALEAQLVLFTENQANQRQMEENDDNEAYQQILGFNQGNANQHGRNPSTGSSTDSSSGEGSDLLTPLQQQELFVVRQQFEKSYHLPRRLHIKRDGCGGNDMDATKSNEKAEVREMFVHSGSESTNSSSSTNAAEQNCGKVKNSTDSSQKLTVATTSYDASESSRQGSAITSPAATIQIPSIVVLPAFPEPSAQPDSSTSPSTSNCNSSNKRGFWKSVFSPQNETHDDESHRIANLLALNRDKGSNSLSIGDAASVRSASSRRSLNPPSPAAARHSSGSQCNIWSSLWGSRVEVNPGVVSMSQQELQNNVIEEEEMGFMEFLMTSGPPPRGS